jgi:hypothetical protein
MNTREILSSAAISFAEAAKSLVAMSNAEKAFRDAMKIDDHVEAEKQRYVAESCLQSYFDHATVAHRLFNDGKKAV